MKKIIFPVFKISCVIALLMLLLLTGWVFSKQDTSIAFGGNFTPQMAQPGGRYQIASCNANSAWIIDTSMGDVYLFYTNGKWKEVGSIMDEKKRIGK